MLFIYSLVLMLNILMTNCEQLRDCTEIDSLKDIVQKEILERKVLMEIVQREMFERKMESSKLLMKIRRLESTQRSRTNAAEIPRLDLEDQHEKMETQFEATDMKRNDLVDEKSNGNNNTVDIMKKGLMSEKQERIKYISYIESQMADIKETVVNFKTETNDFIKQSVATITASQDDFEQDINATLREMEKKAELHIEIVKSELYTVEQDLLETSTNVSELNDIVLGSKIDGGWSPWGKWSSCSVSCGVGTRERRRACTNPSPSVIGRQCEGNSIVTGSCGYSWCTGTVSSKTSLYDDKDDCYTDDDFNNDEDDYQFHYDDIDNDTYNDDFIYDDDEEEYDDGYNDYNNDEDDQHLITTTMMMSPTTMTSSTTTMMKKKKKKKKMRMMMQGERLKEVIDEKGTSRRRTDKLIQ